MKDSREKLVLLDAHAIIHRAYHAMPDFSSTTGEPTGALFGLCNMLVKIIDELEPTYIVACYDLPQKTHRHDVYDGYKATRKKGDDALVQQLTSSREVFAAFGIPIFDCPGFEADDILGTIAAETVTAKNLDIVIASGDMDTMQLIDGTRVQVYTLRKGIHDTVLYDETAMRARFGFGPKQIPDYKGFAGDASDNIPGIKGIGEKTATQLIQTFGGVDGVYQALKKDADTLKKHGFKPKASELIAAGEEESQFSKMLATIRIDAPIAFVLPPQFTLDAVHTMIVALCERYEFRSLATRFRQRFGGAAVPTQVAAQEPTQYESPEIVQKAKLALWLVQSDQTNPSLDAALSCTKTHTAAAALEILQTVIHDRHLSRVFDEIEVPLIPVVEAMNARGVCVDSAYLKSLSAEYHKELKRIEKKIFIHAGKEFNVNSPKQLGVILYDELGIKIVGKARTPGGARSTKESELQKVLDTHPIVPEILVYRELQKLLSTYVDTLPAQVDAAGRLHTTFIQTGTTTGRISSLDPNLQNIPIKTALGKRIREAFVAPSGSVLVALDYAQVELRIAAILSQDEKLIAAFTAGVDVHTVVAADVFNVARDAVTPDMRRKAKVINFGILYGMGVNALRQNLGDGVTQKDARAYLDAYFQKYSRLAEWIDQTKADAKRLGYTQTLFGRRRYFDGFTSSLPFIRAAAERMAVNAPIQGTQADIIKIAMVRADEFIRREHLQDSVHLVLQVHDELVYEVKEADAPHIAEQLEGIMESVLSSSETGGVPIVVAYALGANWGALK